MDVRSSAPALLQTPVKLSVGCSIEESPLIEQPPCENVVLEHNLKNFVDQGLGVFLFKFEALNCLLELRRAF